jgi:hypothetical protein
METPAQPPALARFSGQKALEKRANAGVLPFFRMSATAHLLRRATLRHRCALPRMVMRCRSLATNGNIFTLTAPFKDYLSSMRHCVFSTAVKQSKPHKRGINNENNNVAKIDQDGRYRSLSRPA